MEKKIYTPREAWELLGIGRTRFYQLLKGGKLRYFKNGNRYLIPESAIANFIIEQMAKVVSNLSKRKQMKRRRNGEGSVTKRPDGRYQASRMFHGNRTYNSDL